MAKPIRVLVVDANAAVRTAIVQMLAGAPDMEIIGQATSTDQGLHMTRNLAPDVMILGLEDSGGDTTKMLGELMKLSPTPVIGLGEPGHEGAMPALSAFAEGMAGFFPKDRSASPLAMRKLAPDLIEKVRALGTGVTRNVLVSSFRADTPIPPSYTPGGGRMKVIGLCAGAGGPYTLMRLVTALPENLEAAVVIAQSLPEAYSAPFAEWLDALCALPVREAWQQEALTPGTVLVGQGGKGLAVKKEGENLGLHMVEPGAQPLADGLLSSMAAACPRDAIGIVLSGMGNDGMAGTRNLVSQGGVVLTQTPDTCLVGQMPEAAVEAGAVPVSTDELAREIVGRMSTTDAPVPQPG